GSRRPRRPRHHGRRDRRGTRATAAAWVGPARRRRRRPSWSTWVPSPPSRGPDDRAIRRVAEVELGVAALLLETQARHVVVRRGVELGREPVADAADGDDAAAALLGDEAGAEAAHLHVERRRVAGRAPQLADEGVAGDDATRLAH